MERGRLRDLLRQVSDGDVSVDDALDSLAVLPFEDLGFAKIDHHRSLRVGMPEVIFGAGKTGTQIAAIARRLLDSSVNLLITRLDAERAAEVRRAIPELRYDEQSRLGSVVQKVASVAVRGTICVISAGTSDLPVAEEAASTAELMGNPVERLHDVGISGIHRLLAFQQQIRRAAVLIVVAGMEGALPSVVGGLVERPVIAVPTSIGYGASFGGLAALLAMLNSCAAGITVVNIDNGFGAGVAASIINRAE